MEAAIVPFPEVTDREREVLTSLPRDWAIATSPPGCKLPENGE